MKHLVTSTKGYKFNIKLLSISCGSDTDDGGKVAKVRLHQLQLCQHFYERGFHIDLNRDITLV